MYSFHFLKERQLRFSDPQSPPNAGNEGGLVAVTGATGSGSEGARRGSRIKGKRDHARRKSRGPPDRNMGCSRPRTTPWVNRYRQLSTRLGHRDPPFFGAKSVTPKLILQSSNSLYSYIVTLFNKFGIDLFMTKISDILMYC